MSIDERPKHSLAACAQFIARFLLDPHELLMALAPEGWERSPLRFVFHPSVDQLAEEIVALSRNLDRLGGKPTEMEAVEDSEDDDEEEAPPLPELPLKPIEPEREVVELLGRALWDVFSDNHSVVDVDGVAYDLGSFRSSAGFLADSVNRRYSHLASAYDYMDFYLGSRWSCERADLGPVYRWIFRRLQEAKCRWIYSFPRLYLVDLSRQQDSDDWSEYDPSEAVRRTLTRAEESERRDELRAELERSYADDVEGARFRRLPTPVDREVYGVLPEGWPHPEL
jgi:hypothetical protein